MKLPLLCFAFYLPYTLCIIGGNDVQRDRDETHFVVSLRHKAGAKHFCGGALIVLNFVLTAASCVKDRNLKDFFGHVGLSNLHNSQEGVTLYFDKVLLKDPTGQKLVRNNIALLHLEDRIPDSHEDKVRIIKFFSDTDKAENGARCKAFGWGQTDCSESPILSDVFTRVDSHKDWIIKTMEENSSTLHKPHAIIMTTCIVVLLKTWLHL
ncbi:hypothetical protein HA402_005208 [Bradysia odoriphaga]|nr:hypothetical protein HA402_005208 [Bradysia odoriphaga]